MTTVRFSDTLRSNILRAAEALHAPAIKEVERRSAPPEWTCKRIYTVLFGHWKEKMEEFPGGFFDTIDSIRIQRINGVAPNIYSPSTTFEIKHGDDPLYVPASYAALGGDFTWSRHGGSIHLSARNVPGLQDLADFYQQQNEEQARLKAEMNEFRDGVKAVIYTHSTLAPALRTWPPLWDLLPESAKQRHKEVKARIPAPTRKNLIEENEVDLTKLTGKVTAHKLTSGQ